MSDKSLMTMLSEDDERSNLRNQVGFLMLKGAGYGAAVFVGILIFMFITGGIGQLLPPESKQMPDPNVMWRDSALHLPVETLTV